MTATLHMFIIHNSLIIPSFIAMQCDLLKALSINKGGGGDDDDLHMNALTD